MFYNISWYLCQSAIWKQWYCWWFYKVDLDNCYVLLQKSSILYLMVYFISRLMVQQWDYPLDLLLITHFFHTMKKTDKQGFKPVFYQCYLDSIFVLIKWNDHLKYFQEFLNSFHFNICFSVETERGKKFSFSMKLFANNVNMQPQFFVNLLFVGYIVTLKVSYLLVTNLVWYTP